MGFAVSIGRIAHRLGHTGIVVLDEFVVSRQEELNRSRVSLPSRTALELSIYAPAEMMFNAHYVQPTGRASTGQRICRQQLEDLMYRAATHVLEMPWRI